MYITANAKVREHSGFHTKGYIFKKDESYQIIIGSSNLTQSALTYNKEWNTRLDSKENEKFVKMFAWVQLFMEQWKRKVLWWL